MSIVQNYFMAVFAIFSICVALGFLFSEREGGLIREYLIRLGIACCITNLGYTLMSLCPIGPYTLFLRNIGLWGMNIFVYLWFRFIFANVNGMVKHKKILNNIVLVSLVVVLVLNSLPNEIEFVSDVDGFTSFISNHRIGYYAEIFYVIICVISLISFLILWGRQETSKRGRRYVVTLLVAIIFFAVSATPYFLGIETSHPAFLYCLGGTLALFTAWQAGVRNSNYVITIHTLGDDMFGAVNTGLLIFDHNGELVLINEYAKSNLKIYEVKHQKMYELFKIPIKDYEEILAELREKGNCEYKCSASVGNGKYQLNAFIKFDKFGEPLCIITSVTDITREEEMIKEIIQANKAKSDFLASVSHEIRTPINAILGMNELILRESPNSEISGYAQNIETSGRLLMSLVNDILDLSKVESGKMGLVLDNYELAGVINDVYVMLAARAEAKNLSLKIDVDEKVPRELFGDEVRIRQVISNLVANSIKYTDEGSITIKTSATVDGSNANITIKVEDTGRGIKEEDINSIFESFTRADELKNRSIEGTGLGLAITKTFVEMMGGTISAKSEYGKGSTFIVTIPQEIVDATPVGDFADRVKEYQISRSNRGTRLSADGIRVLVVDDVDINCKVVEGLLRGSKANVESVLSGREAVLRCKEEKYDIIFMDHMMPEMDGIETLAEIKKVGLNTDTPVVVLTANTVLGAKEEYLKAGFDGFLAKPVIPSELDDIVLNIIPDKVTENKTLEKEQVSNILESDSATIKKLVNSVPGLFVKDAIDKYAGTLDFYLEMLEEFCSSDRIEKLIEDYKREDYSSYRMNAHTLKGMSRAVGLYNLTSLFEDLQFACDREDYDFIKEHHNAAINEVNDVITNVVGLNIFS